MQGLPKHREVFVLLFKKNNKKQQKTGGDVMSLVQLPLVAVFTPCLSQWGISMTD